MQWVTTLSSSRTGRNLRVVFTATSVASWPAETLPSSTSPSGHFYNSSNLRTPACQSASPSLTRSSTWSPKSPNAILSPTTKTTKMAKAKSSHLRADAWSYWATTPRLLSRDKKRRRRLCPGFVDHILTSSYIYRLFLLMRYTLNAARYSMLMQDIFTAGVPGADYFQHF